MIATHTVFDRQLSAEPRELRDRLIQQVVAPTFEEMGPWAIWSERGLAARSRADFTALMPKERRR